MNAPQFWFAMSLMVALSPTRAIAAMNRSAQVVTPASPQPISLVSPVFLAQYAPPPPPSRGAPGGNRGAASRGCVLVARKSPDPDLNSLIALVPQTRGQRGAEVWGQTAVERPTFWFYIPYKTTAIAQIEFVLNDDQDNRLYKFPVSVPPEAGIISVQLPPNASLQPGKLYNWFFKVRLKSSACSSTSANAAETPSSSSTESDGQTPIYVEGWIQHVLPSPTLSTQLQQSSPSQQAALYGQNGYWYDALTAIATEHQARPSDPAIAAQWAALLKQAQMEKLADQLLVK